MAVVGSAVDWEWAKARWEVVDFAVVCDTNRALEGYRKALALGLAVVTPYLDRVRVLALEGALDRTRSQLVGCNGIRHVADALNVRATWM